MAKKILIVEDETELVDMLKTRLEAAGYESMSAGDGDKALEMLESDAFDLIILDIGLPGMDGYTFVREFKSKTDVKKIPIIVLTARTEMKDLFKAEGIEDYFIKPYDKDAFFEKIKERLGE